MVRVRGADGGQGEWRVCAGCCRPEVRAAHVLPPAVACGPPSEPHTCPAGPGDALPEGSGPRAAAPEVLLVDLREVDGRWAVGGRPRVKAGATGFQPVPHACPSAGCKQASGHPRAQLTGKLVRWHTLPRLMDIAAYTAAVASGPTLNQSMDICRAVWRQSRDGSRWGELCGARAQARRQQQHPRRLARPPACPHLPEPAVARAP